MSKNNEKTLDQVLDMFISSPAVKSKLLQVKLESIWMKLMGPKINGFTENIYLRKNGILVLTITSSPLKNELNFSREKIKSKLNKELGSDQIKEVVIW